MNIFDLRRLMVTKTWSKTKWKCVFIRKIVILIQNVLHVFHCAGLCKILT